MSTHDEGPLIKPEPDLGLLVKGGTWKPPGVCRVTRSTVRDQLVGSPLCPICGAQPTEACRG